MVQQWRECKHFAEMTKPAEGKIRRISVYIVLTPHVPGILAVFRAGFFASGFHRAFSALGSCSAPTNKSYAASRSSLLLSSLRCSYISNDECADRKTSFTARRPSVQWPVFYLFVQQPSLPPSRLLQPVPPQVPQLATQHTSPFATPSNSAQASSRRGEGHGDGEGSPNILTTDSATLSCSWTMRRHE